MKTTVTLVFAALQFAMIADAQTYTIQQIGLTDQIYTSPTGDSTNQLYGVNAAGQVFGNALRYAGGASDGDDTWVYSPTTHTTQLIGLTKSALPGMGGIPINDPVDMNAGGQVAGYAYRYFSGETNRAGFAWLYSPTTGTTQVIGLTDPVHAQTDGSSTNFPMGLNASGQVIGYAYRQHYDNYFAGQDVWVYSPATNTTQVIGLTGPAYTGAYAGPFGTSSNLVVTQNAAGQVVGAASGGGSPGNEGDAWIYSPATGATQRIGIYDSLHTENGYHYNRPVALNASGQVAGTANHYKITGLPYNGQDAWIYSSTTSSLTQIGLVDAAHTQTGDYSYHKPVALNDSGQIVGLSSRFSGSTDQGQDAWLYSSTTNSTQLIGLTDGGHIKSGGYLFNQPNGMNAAGEVIGYAKRYNGSAEQGQDAWFYSATTHASQAIGLIDRPHTQVDGTSLNNTAFVNAGGLIVGTAKRYNGSPDPTMSDEGIDSWLFDPVSRVTYNLVSSPSATGFASSAVSYLGDDGTVVGSYAVNGGAVQDAFLWTEATGFHDLGDLVQGGLTASGWASLADAYGGNLVDAYDGNGGPYIIGDGALGNGSAGVFELAPASALAGDFNHNGVVDAADYVVWRNGLGTTYTQADYDVWRTHFGQTAGSGAALPSAEPLSSVPEPASCVLMVIAAVALFTRRSWS